VPYAEGLGRDIVAPRASLRTVSFVRARQPFCFLKAYLAAALLGLPSAEGSELVGFVCLPRVCRDALANTPELSNELAIWAPTAGVMRAWR
jgi:hypothetical protein